jgi:hypothetical protein
MYAAIEGVDIVSVLRERQALFAAQVDLTLEQYLKIVRACNTDEAITVLELLRVSTFKSQSRAHCARKVREWVGNESAIGKPLNIWEFERCRPTWKIRYSLPTVHY